MLLLALVATPLVLALAPALAARMGRGASAGIAIAIGAVAFGLVLAAAPAVLRGDTLALHLPWIPSLGIALSLRMDGLALLFALLVTGIGLLVLVYTPRYLGPDEPLGGFLARLLLFEGAMLGLVLGENLILVLVFWELTSLSSFLLIGFVPRHADARRAALVAIMATGLGGLALLAAAVLIERIVGSYALTAIVAAGPAIAADPLAPVVVVLVALGAFTKSAQVPFQFWLPAAMAAPTPVSAYLHSAAMVKAGVYLMLRLHPALAETAGFGPLLIAIGLASALVGGFRALRERDLKGLLAYSTVSHLGFMTTLVGIGTRAAVVAATLHALNHALFKAALFLSAGVVDRATGTRDLGRLGGLTHAMPVLGVASLAAVAALAGLPPLAGYVSKDRMLAAALEAPLGGLALPALAILAAALSAAYAYRLAPLFLGPLRAPAREAGARLRADAPMTAPVVLLGGLCLALGLAPGIAGPLVDAAAGAVLAGEVEAELALYEGVTPAFVAGLAALALGAAVWWAQPRLSARVVERRPRDGRVVAALEAACRGAHALAARIRALGLPLYLGLQVAVFLALGLAFGRDLALPLDRVTPVDGMSLVVWALLLFLLALAVSARERVFSLVAVSAAGVLTSLVFVHFSAPDLAMTQLVVGILTTLLMLIILQSFPRRRPRAVLSRWSAVRGALCLAAGLGLGLATLAVSTRQETPLAAWTLAHAETLTGMSNVVNAVVVDFRAFDTFGETTVVALAALGLYALVHALMTRRPNLRPRLDIEAERAGNPVMLRAVAQLTLPLATVLAMFLLFRGHSAPGGGFVAAVVLACAAILLYLAESVEWTEAHAPVHYGDVVALGLALMLAAGATGFAAAGFLDFAHGTFEPGALGALSLSTSLLFDVGVFVAVAGAALIMLIAVSGAEME